MAYAAVISLKQTLHRLLHSSQPPFIASSTQDILESAYNHTMFLQKILTRLDYCSSGNLNYLDDQIRDEVQNLEDLLELHELNHLLGQSESSAHAQEFGKVTQGILSFCETAEKIAMDCVAEIGQISSEEEEEDEEDRAVPPHARIEDSFDYADIERHLTERRRPNDFGVFQIVGPPGCGTTVAVPVIFEDLKHCFDCCARVTVGPQYKHREILLSILAQINESNEFLDEKEDEEIGEFLYASLKGWRYMIVLEDVRDEEIWNFLESLFPVQDNGSAVVVVITRRRRGRDWLPIENSFMRYNMDCRHEDSWWYLLRSAVFDSGPCPPELEEAGKKIVEHCKSLGIVVLKVTLLLLKGEKTPEYWKELADDQDNPIFSVDDEVSEIRKIEEELSSASFSYMDDEEKGLLLELIDFSFHIESIKMEIFPKTFFPNMLTLSFLGMAGIGKTSLVKKVYEDPRIRCNFDHHLWLTLGPEYKSEEILVDLLAQIYFDIDKKQIKENEDLIMSLCDQLTDKKCLIVLDDVWSKKSLHYMRKLFPNIKGAALITTRLSEVAKIGGDDIVFEMQLLNEEESWHLFCKQLFGDELCPFPLEKAGKKIVENCEGLPLMIVAVASLLSQVERTPERWNGEAHKNSPIFRAAYDQISGVLDSSYDHLPRHLKECFLYIGMFPQNEEIRSSKLVIFWIAEGLLEPKPGQTVEDYAAECLLELHNQSVVMVSQKASDFTIKSFSLHSVFWHLSNEVAEGSKFFHALNRLSDFTTEDMDSQRRLCIRNSTLLSIKASHDIIASISTTRSLLSTGPPHQYPVPVCFGLRLLRLMDALSIRLYEFPVELVESYSLRYLALRYDGCLPSSVSKLSNLQFFIVSRHLSIKSSTDISYLPMEIWDMEELKHLQIAGSNLPNPKHGIRRQNLLTLLEVSASSCTKKVLKSVPNLKKLGIQIELEPDEKGNPFRCLNRISRLRGLESLKCVVVNPELAQDGVGPPAPRSMYPWGLKKLSLSGLGYPWSYMKIISKLENLKVLKLRCYAFQGAEWEMDDDELESLQFLLIEDTDLIRWKFSTAAFVVLKCLCIKQCYQLEELPPELSTSVTTLEVVDCNPFVENWAKELEEAGSKTVSSWNARK